MDRLISRSPGYAGRGFARGALSSIGRRAWGTLEVWGAAYLNSKLPKSKAVPSKKPDRMLYSRASLSRRGADCWTGRKFVQPRFN
jgi:hypothetical protein